MNTSDFDDESVDAFPRVVYNHKEMKNLTNHLYLRHLGALSKKTGATAPFEDKIISISPKVFSLLMLAHHDVMFSPDQINEHRGIVLEWKCKLGRLCVASHNATAWKTPWSGSEHIALAFMFEHINASSVDQIQTRFPDLKFFVEIGSAAVNAKMEYKIDNGCYLEDVSNATFRWLKQLYEVDKFICRAFEQN